MTTILFLTASPKDLNDLDLEGEANMIQDAILHRAFADEIKVAARAGRQPLVTCNNSW